jgi:hypothetical protein
MTVQLTDLEYPVPRFPDTDQALPAAAGRPDGPRALSLRPHLNVPSDIIVFYKSDAGGDAPAWSSQVYRFDPATGAMRRIV